LLDAAQAVLLAKGMHDTTMADVAVAAGLGKGTIYLYFESKQALLGALRRRYVDQIATELRASQTKADSASDEIAGLVRALITEGSRRPDLHHLLFHAAGIEEEEDAFVPVAAIFAEVVVRGRFDVSDTSLATHFVLGGAHAALVAAAHGAPAKRRRIIDEAIVFSLRALGAERAGRGAHT
jgi:AcrR family transcriptional regulator